MKYRPHKGTLADSIKETVNIDSYDKLLQHVRDRFPIMRIDSVRIDYYCYDRRINEDTYIIMGIGENEGYPPEFVVGWSDCQFK